MRLVARGDASCLHEAAGPSGRCSSARPSLHDVLLGRAPFASLAMAASAAANSAAAAAAAAVRPPVVERRTGTLFPGELERCAGAKGCPIALGAGSRTKRVAGIKTIDVYTLALYVDPAAAKQLLGGRAGSSAEALARDQALFDDLTRQDSLQKTLRVVITSGLVKRRAFLEALEGRLEAPLRAAGQLPAMATFAAQFDGAHFRKGLQIEFTAGGGRLTTTIDGRQVGTIASPALAHALLDIYVGPDPASQGAKDAIGAGLAGVVLGSA